MITFYNDFTRIDTGIWKDHFRNLSTNLGRTHGNGEMQYYSLMPGNHEIGSGFLRLRADRLEALAGYPYTSGMLATWGTIAQLYGRFEIRCRVPKGKGFWPTFCLFANTNPQTWPPEIDIAEFRGDEPTTVHLNSHYKDVQGNNQSTNAIYTGPDFTQDFHTFTLDWLPDLLEWRVDGIKRAETMIGVPIIPMALFLLFAVGGTWPGNPDDFTKFPAFWDVDYIKVEQF